MNIVFFGSSLFAVASLEALLIRGYNIRAVVTQPDRLKGRGLLASVTAIKNVSLSNNLNIYQPENVNTSQAIEFLNGFGADLFVVVSYGQILSAKVLNIPKLFCVNAHASLLPKYRGAAPINWAIINGETQTGITIIKMCEKMDAGEIIIQKKIDIDIFDNVVTLENKLAGYAANSLLECLSRITSNDFQLLPQDENGVSLAPKLKKEDGLIDWNISAVKIVNLIKGTLQWPGAFTYYKGKLLKIHKATASIASVADKPVGCILEVSKKGIFVITGEGILLIEMLQLEGKRIMGAEEFIAGNKIFPGDILGEKK